MELRKLATVILLAISFGYSASQSISCTYGFMLVGDTQRYTCYLSIQNPDGFDNFTTISGPHVPGLSNTFVTAVMRMYINSMTLNIPQIICRQFPHLTFIDLSYLDIQNVDVNSFRGCRALDHLRIHRNQINELPENLFRFNPLLEYLDMESNQIQTLPVNFFEQQINLNFLEISNNPITSLPGGLFRNTERLASLHMTNIGINEIDGNWFDNLFNLENLDMSHNNITNQIPSNAFRNLRNLRSFFLVGSNIAEFNGDWFRSMPNLEYLRMMQNRIDFIPPNSLDQFRNLLVFDLSLNMISHMPADIFINLNNIVEISLANNSLTSLNPQWFQGMSTLEKLYLDHNQITSLPNGVFSSSHILQDLSLFGNNLRTLSRDAFGFVGNLFYLDMELNEINSVDERLLNETTSLYYFYFGHNICADGFFFNFALNRDQYMPRFETCIENFARLNEIQTSAGFLYNFFGASLPGVDILVASDSEIHIALTPFDSVSIPMVEIVIGTNNNSRSRIIRNMDAIVAELPTPNIIRRGQWMRFRITWARHVILVFEGDDDHPFLAYSLEYLVPINFVGLRSPNTQAVWILDDIQ